MEYSNFDPGDIEELVAAMTSEIGDVAINWWNETSGAMSPHLQTLAMAALQTRLGHEAGHITSERVKAEMNSQKLLLDTILLAIGLREMVLRQRVVDAVAKLVGWAIFNRTGINVFPDLVTPE